MKRRTPRRPAAAARRLRLRAAAAALGVATAGCGAALERFERLELAPAGAAPPAAAVETRARIVPADERERWSADAPHRLRVAGGGDEPGALVLRAGAVPREIELVRAGRIDPSRVNRVALWASFRGAGWLRAELRRDGARVGGSQRVELVPSSAPRLLQLDLLLDAPGAGPADALVLVIAGAPRRLALRRLDLEWVPLPARLPDPSGEPGLVVVGGEGRRGEGVSADRPVSVRFDAPEGARLSFSWAQPEAVRRLSAPSTLRLRVSHGEGGWRRSRTLTLPPGPGWQSAQVELESLSDQTLEARFEVIRAGQGEAAWAVAEVAVWTPHWTPRAVLLVTSSAHRADHLGAMRRGVSLETPTLDGLAERGVLFENCFSPTNATQPAHAALMTGTHPRDTGILANHRALPEAARTLAEAFRDAGYLTWAAVGARHLGHDQSGLGQGFDRIGWPEGPPRGAMASVDLLGTWLEDAGERPLFAWLHLFDAHWPYAPPAPYDRLYDDRAADPTAPIPGAEPPPDPGLLPVDLQGVRDLEQPRARYAGEIGYLDRALAPLLEHPRFAEAIVAFTADHGEGLGRHHVFFDHVTLAPEVLHVPLILRWPGAPAGARSDAPVSPLGLGRTLLDLAGLADVAFPGESLVPVAEGRRDAAPRFHLSANAHAASVEHRGRYLSLALRRHAYRHARRASERHEVRLCDLDLDPGCARDGVSDPAPEAAAVLRAQLLDWLARAPDAAAGSALFAEDDCDWCRRFGGAPAGTSAADAHAAPR